MDKGLQIYTLGGVRILMDGKPVTGFGTRKAEALLVYLACTRRPHPREALADLLWDERSQSQALGNLRVVLNRLRQQLGDYLSITREAVGLKPSAPVRLDAADLEESLLSSQKAGGIQSETSASQVGQAIMQLYRGEFLVGFTVFECRQFEDWVTQERERLHYLVIDRLNELVAYELEHGNYSPGLEHAARLLALDPLMETAHQQMMLLLAYSGQRAGALDQYETCRKILAAELQVEPSTAITQLYKSIRDGTLETGRWAVPSPVKEPPAPGFCPYKGLQFFDEEDAPLFFGREALVARLVERLFLSDEEDPTSGYQIPWQRFLAVIGASGSGKSSAVRAGLAPVIRRSRDWDIQIITPTAHPLEALSLLPGPLSRAGTGNGSYLLIVDQFEELFSLCREEAERKAFIDHLLSLVEPGWQGAIYLVIVLRADFYAACAPYENLREALGQRQEYIGPMSAAELRLAIEEPARLGKWELEAGLVELFLRDIGAGIEGQEAEPGALPLLSHALMETWLRRQGRTLTLAGYAEAGGVRGAVARTAESVYAQLTTQEQSLARSIFLRLTELGEGTQETRRRAALSELVPPAEPAGLSPGAGIQRVLKTLADARLVTTTAETAEVAHEALIREWGRLQDWLNEDREGLHLHRRLTEAAQEWDRLHGDPGMLYRGMRLVQALEWESAHPSASNALEKAFLQASRAEAEREAAEREAQRQRELEAAQRLAEAERQRAGEQRQAARRLRRRAVSLSISLAAAFLLMLLAAALAMQSNRNLKAAEIASTQALAQEATAQAASKEALAQRSTAEAASIQAISEAGLRATAESIAVQEKETAQQQTRLATARELASAALNNLQVDQERSMLLAMQAVKTADIPEAENALHQAILAMRLQDTLTGHSGPVYGVAFAPNPSPEARRFATAGQDGTIKIWELDETDRKVKGTPLATISNPTDYEIWAEASGYGLAFSPDGELLAAIGSEQTAKIWEAASGRLLHTLSGHSGKVIGLTFSPTGELLVTGSEDSTAKIWDTRSGEELQTLTGYTTLAGPAVFSPDGNRLACSDFWAGKVTIWDRVEGPSAATDSVRFNQAFTIESLFHVASALAFSPDGERLAIGYNDIKVYDLSSATAAAPPRLVLNFPAHENILNGLVYSPDGRLLISGSGDGTARVWDAETGQALFSLPGTAGLITSIAQSSDGELLFTAHSDSRVKVWDLTVEGSREWLTIPDMNIGYYSRDGDRLVMINSDPENPKILVLELSPTGAREISSISLEHGYPETIFDVDQELSRLVTLYPNDYLIHVWDPATGQEVDTFSIEASPAGAGHTTTDLFNMKLSPDGTRLVTGGSDGSAFLWDVQTGRLLHTLEGHTAPFAGWDAMAFSPDGALLAMANSDGSLRIWDANRGKLLHDLPGNTALPNVSFSPDGKWLLATGEGTTINLWDVQTGQSLLTLPGSATLVNNLGISPDGQYLAAAHLDGTVRLWDAGTGQELLSLPGIYMRFSEDGKHLITFKEEAIYGLTLDIDELMELARGRLTRSWTPDECSKFLHTETCPPAP